MEDEDENNSDLKAVMPPKDIKDIKDIKGEKNGKQSKMNENNNRSSAEDTPRSTKTKI